jgi:hypothetical protein
MALAPQDGTPAKITATVTGNSGPVTLAVGGVPSGTLSQVVEPGSSGSGAITLTSSALTPAGSYSLKVTADDGGSAASQNLIVVVAVSGVVGSTVDQTQGVNGKLQQFMSTSFQPAEWDYQYFQNQAALEPAQLNQLSPQHIRLQGLSQAVPMKSNTGAATDWDFSKLDAVVQPVLSAADHSPEFQIAVAPAFMDNAQGTFDIANHLQDFANYSADLVRYYNGPGFDWGGQHFESPSLLSANPHKSPGGPSSTSTTSTASPRPSTSSSITPWCQRCSPSIPPSSFPPWSCRTSIFRKAIRAIICPLSFFRQTRAASTPR